PSWCQTRHEEVRPLPRGSVPQRPQSRQPFSPGHLLASDTPRRRITASSLVRHLQGRRGEDGATTSKSAPVIRPSVCRASFDQCELGAPETYQLEPLSARIIPYVLRAWSTIRAWRGKPEMSTPALTRTRRPIGGSAGSSELDA